MISLLKGGDEIAPFLRVQWNFVAAKFHLIFRSFSATENFYFFCLFED